MSEKIEQPQKSEVRESTINIEDWARELMPTSEELYYDESKCKNY
tara:strand:- start:425 stop:559 length:135 start_codon:yes stop_codon:yes gene_type:complete